MSRASAKDQFDWRGPAAARRRSFSFFRLGKELLIPPKGYRVVPTSAGLLMILVGLCLGLAAYNTENNILFAALSLLIASLILSGILCWSNFLSARWRLETSATFRVGEDCQATVVLENYRRRFPLLCLAFDLDFASEALAKRLYLKEGLDSGEADRLTWSFKPAKRCQTSVSISEASSSFPFGFLRKHVPGECSQPILVWPQRIAYTRYKSKGGRLHWQGLSARKRGATGELLGLRGYQSGDAMKAVHWKASAKQRRLVVKQNASEQQVVYRMEVDPSQYLWTSEALFEKMCSLATSLAEDLFLEGRLESCSIVGELMIKVDRVADLEAFFDALAKLEPSSVKSVPREEREGRTICLRPIEDVTIGAFLNGEKIVQA